MIKLLDLETMCPLMQNRVNFQRICKSFRYIQFSTRGRHFDRFANSTIVLVNISIGLLVVSGRAGFKIVSGGIIGIELTGRIWALEVNVER